MEDELNPDPNCLCHGEITLTIQNLIRTVDHCCRCLFIYSYYLFFQSLATRTELEILLILSLNFSTY